MLIFWLERFVKKTHPDEICLVLYSNCNFPTPTCDGYLNWIVIVLTIINISPREQTEKCSCKKIQDLGVLG